MLAFAIVVTQDKIDTEWAKERVNKKHNTICNWGNGIWFSFQGKMISKKNKKILKMKRINK